MKKRIYHILWIFPVIGIGIYAIYITSIDSVMNDSATIRQEFSATSSDFAIVTVAGGLNSPVAAAFTPDGRIFVTEKIGNVRVIKNGVLLSEPLVHLDHVNVHGDHGLLGIAVDPDFDSNGFIYLGYTYDNNPSDVEGPKTGQIVRITVDGDVAVPNSIVTLLGSVVGDTIHPSCNDFPISSDCIPSDAGSHSVGALRFGSDGKLYASLADGARFDEDDPDALRSLDLDSFAGKIVRINTDGTAPSDNPFYTGDPNANKSKIYAYGIRNSFRFNFRPSTNALYIGEVGWYTTDEINLGHAGANYGWPCREGTDATPHYDCTTENYLDPLYSIPNEHTATSVYAVMGGAFSGDAYPQPYKDNYFFGIFGKDHIKRMVFDKNNSVLIPAENFIAGADGPVDFITGPDGSIYFVSIYTGEIRHIVYAPDRPLEIMAKAQPQFGAVPLTITFSSEANQDSNDMIVSYLWDFGDGTTANTQNSEHIYTEPGIYNASLTVRDNLNSSSTIDIAIRAIKKSELNNNSLPQLLKTIATPSNIVVAELVTVLATIGNTSDSKPFLINIEIHDGKGNTHSAQQYYDNVIITPGTQQTFTLGWIPKTAGTYKVSLGVYSAGWQELYQWIDNALTLTVGNRRPEGE